MTSSLLELVLQQAANRKTAGEFRMKINKMTLVPCS
jgi:hypothetical protein